MIIGGVSVGVDVIVGVSVIVGEGSGVFVGVAGSTVDVGGTAAG
jgi:hypothetical protein